MDGFRLVERQILIYFGDYEEKLSIFNPIPFCWLYNVIIISAKKNKKCCLWKNNKNSKTKKLKN
jgi:hypothetical protein